MRLNDFPLFMIFALLVTVFTETLIAFALGYRKMDLINVILVNIMTNPVVTSIPVYFNINYGIKQRNIVLLILEILTVIIEGFIYKKYFAKRDINPYKLSLILNLSSYLLGVLINYIRM